MVKGKDLGWGMGARERAQDWALSYILLPHPSSLSLTSGRQLNAFCFSGKRITSIAPAPLCGCAIRVVQVINNL